MVIYEDDTRQKSCVAALVEVRTRYSGDEIMIALRDEGRRNFQGAQVPKDMARTIGEELIRLSKI